MTVRSVLRDGPNTPAATKLHGPVPCLTAVKPTATVWMEDTGGCAALLPRMAAPFEVDDASGGAALARRRLAWAAPVSWARADARGSRYTRAIRQREKCPATPGERHRRRRRQPPNAQAKDLAKRPWRHVAFPCWREAAAATRGPPKEQAARIAAGAGESRGKEDSRANPMAPGHGPHLPWRHAPCPPLPPPADHAPQRPAHRTWRAHGALRGLLHARAVPRWL